MIKFLLIIAAAGGVFLLTPAGDQLKAKALSIVNPAAIERNTLADLEENLDEISKTVSQPAFQSLNNTEKTKALKTMLGQANQILDEAQDTAEKSDFAATISNVVKNVLPKSWTTQPICPTQ